MRKGQLSLFLILALLLLLGSIAGYYVYSMMQEEKAQKAAEEIAKKDQAATQLREFFFACIKKNSYDGLELIGRQGGYSEIPRSFEFEKTGLWQFESANVQPFLNTTQKELIRYLNLNLPPCIDEGIAKEQGFSLEKKDLKVDVEFADSDVVIRADYPLTLRQGEYLAQYSDFTQRIALPYRRIFEAATKLNEHVLLAEFEKNDPLKGTERYGFELSYVRKGEDGFIFSVKDTTFQTPNGIPYQISFGVKRGDSHLIKRTALENFSSSNPSLFGFDVASPDNLAILQISAGTTISKDGQDVSAIEVNQIYDSEVITKNVPVSKVNDNIASRKDLSYVTNNPIYSFEPSGLTFSQPQKLSIHYEDNELNRGGMGMLQGENGFWFPIKSYEDKETRQVYSYISGFTDFTAVDCQSQQVKTVSAEHVQEASPVCYVMLAASVVSMASMASFFAGGGSFSQFGIMGLGDVQNIGNMMMGGMSSAGLSTSTISVLSPMAWGSIAVISTVISTVGFVGGLLDPNLFYQESPKNCQNYITTCAQTATTVKEEKDGTGTCVPEGDKSIGAGQPSTVCAQVEKCNMLNSFFCMPCSVKCTVTYK